MKVLIFDIKGRFAHFRKIYTNSSSLSYTLPPRTTVMGMIAAILGRERDTYYEEFNSQNMDIAVQKINPTRKIMQSL
ncbi:MAG: CRISPR-associated protein Cas5, partial [Syntrophomonadaceae bacterium]|nr:CRISPR-associated protein Cas5 [Syntrophomonadaceae bacterium]